jgi:DNA mismatch endonuclease (patch repair protein)
MLRPHMQKVKAKNTMPEIKVRRLLRELGYRGYRVHYKQLPGKPDIAFTKLKKAIFVHGCFWHGHNCRAGRNTPQTNQEYWVPKLVRNKERDRQRLDKIKGMGWQVLIVWECQLKDMDVLAQRIKAFLCVSSI